jgi:hypothetical protein
VTAIENEFQEALSGVGQPAAQGAPFSEKGSFLRDGTSIGVGNP